MKRFISLICSSFALAILFNNAAPAHPSWAIVVDGESRIYLSDLEKIWKIDAGGAVSIFAERHTHELALDAEANLLGEELNYKPATQKFGASRRMANFPTRSPRPKILRKASAFGRIGRARHFISGKPKPSRANFIC